MAMNRRADHHHVDTLRRYLTVGFWFLAAGASAVLGLDLEPDPQP